MTCTSLFGISGQSFSNNDLKISTSTCQIPQLLIQLARPTPGQAIRVSPLPLLRSVLVPPPNAAAHPGSNPSLTFCPSNTRPTSRRFYTPSAPQPVLLGAKPKASSPTAHLSTLRAKAKARENSPPKTLKKDPRKSIRAPRKDQPKALAKGPARAKTKAKEKERAALSSPSSLCSTDLL